jgi:hypothetical protein
MLSNSAIIRIARHILSQEQDIGVGYIWTALNFNKEEIEKEIVGEAYKRILQTPDGSFFYEKDITKSGMDYADYILLREN